MNIKYPIGFLQVPEEVSLEEVGKLMEDLESYTTRLREVVDNLTDEQLAKTYREGSWNVRQLVHHIADSQLTMYQRLKLALTDDAPKAPNFEQDRWAVLADTELPVEPSIKMLEGINERIVYLSKHLTETDLNRDFIHAKNGRITVATKLVKLRWHEEHHLAHIKIALEK